MFTGWERPSHWLVVAVVVVVLFGYKKLPDAARSVGRSLRIFKTEIKGMGEDDKARDKAHEQARTPDVAVTPPAPVAPTAAPAATPVPAAPTSAAAPASAAATPAAEKPATAAE
jgi:sec-independent protein translocase protein TatA